MTDPAHDSVLLGMFDRRDTLKRLHDQCEANVKEFFLLRAVYAHSVNRLDMEISAGLKP